MRLIERMAREICQAHGWQFPDVMVLDDYHSLVKGPKGSTVISDLDIERRQELWRLFVPEAQAALAVINKANLSED